MSNCVSLNITSRNLGSWLSGKSLPESHQEMRYPNVTGCRKLGWHSTPDPLRPRTRQDFICCCWQCLYNLRPECALHCSKDFKDKQGVLKLMSEHYAPQSLYTIYRITSYLRLLAVCLSILICSPNMSFLTWLVSNNSRSLKNELGHCPPQPPPKETVSTRVWVRVHGYLCVRF